jgi:hypothetical protein
VRQYQRIPSSVVMLQATRRLARETLEHRIWANLALVRRPSLPTGAATLRAEGKACLATVKDEPEWREESRNFPAASLVEEEHLEAASDGEKRILGAKKTHHMMLCYACGFVTDRDCDLRLSISR